jgi:DNA repair photolyase
MSVIYEPKGRALEYAGLAANIMRGCGHRCLYCFAPSILRIKSEIFHTEIDVRKNVFNQLSNDLKKLKGDKRRILLSFTTDPYQPAENYLKVTRRAIQMIKRAGMNVEILTKGGTMARRDFDLLNSDDRFAASLTFCKYDDSKHWEPGAATPADRMEALEIAKLQGITTWASMEPVIDPKQTLIMIRQSHRFVDLFKIGTLNHHPHAKTINWVKFGRDVVDLMDKLGNAYYIKKDLMDKLDYHTKGRVQKAAERFSDQTPSSEKSCEKQQSLF